MSVERDHHYVSQFHLRKWENADGKVYQWGRIPYNGKLVVKLVSTAGTAYKPGLYALQHTPPEEAQQIEERILGKIESEAAPVLEKLIDSGPSSLSVRERYWWTMYMNAANIRLPHIIEMLNEESGELVRQHLQQDHDEYLAVKGDAPEETLLEWAENHTPAYLSNTGLRIFVKLLNDERIIDRLIHLRWEVRDISASNRSLLIGDAPMLRVNDLFGPRCLISIALSPNHLFVATEGYHIAERVMTMQAREAAKAHNVSALTEAKQFAYGSAERSFVERYLLRDLVKSKQ